MLHVVLLKAWAGIALIIVSASTTRTSTAFTIIALILYLLFAVVGAAASQLVRRKLFHSVRTLLRYAILCSLDSCA